MNETFGSYIRRRRQERYQSDRRYSVRGVAAMVGVYPCYISKVEREDVAPPSEETIKRLAVALNEDPDLLLAMAGKVSADLRDAILKRPTLFADLIRQLKDSPDNAILRVVREVRESKEVDYGA